VVHPDGEIRQTSHASGTEGNNKFDQFDLTRPSVDRSIARAYDRVLISFGQPRRLRKQLLPGGEDGTGYETDGLGLSAVR
jgi:hypothetical protein